MSTNVENKRTTRVRYNRELILKETNQRANSPLNIVLGKYKLLTGNENESKLAFN